MNDDAFRALCLVTLTSVAAYKIHRRKLDKIIALHTQEKIYEHSAGFRNGFQQGYDEGKRRGYLDTDSQ